MNIEELRDYCLVLPGTEEKVPFEGFFLNFQAVVLGRWEWGIDARFFQSHHIET